MTQKLDAYIASSPRNRSVFLDLVKEFKELVDLADEEGVAMYDESMEIMSLLFTRYIAMVNEKGAVLLSESGEGGRSVAVYE